MACSTTCTRCYSLVEGFIKDNELTFNNESDLMEAAKVGCFKVRKPSSFNVKAGREFANAFRRKECYQSMGKLNLIEGYHTPKYSQTERLVFDRDNWNKFFPGDIIVLGEKLNSIAVTILQTLLLRAGLNYSDLSKSSGGSVNNDGSHMLLFNYYNPDVDKKGLKQNGINPHKDWGFITILDTNKPGLEAWIDDEFVPIKHEEDFLIINFGRALELLTENSAFPVTASIHKVCFQSNDSDARVSTALFLGPNRTENVYRIKTGVLEKYDSVHNFNRMCAYGIFSDYKSSKKSIIVSKLLKKVSKLTKLFDL